MSLPDADAVARALVALGTLILAAPELKPIALQLGWAERVQAVQPPTTLAGDVAHLLGLSK